MSVENNLIHIKKYKNAQMCASNENIGIAF